MSTKSSIKWREQTDTAPGFHLYDDALDDGNPPPVYLRIDGVEADLSTTAGGATVTLTLPREVAQALGLLSADQSGEDAANGAPSDTGNAEADRIINRLSSSDPEFDDCIDAVAFIRKLVAEHKGPEGFATWNDAAVWERQRRLAAEKSLRDTSKELICAVAEQSVDQVDDNGAIGEREAFRLSDSEASKLYYSSAHDPLSGFVAKLNAALDRASLTAEKVAAEPIYQFRVSGCSDWYDGHPDLTDGRTYETRMVIDAQQPAQTQVALTPDQIDAIYEASLARWDARNRCAPNLWHEFARAILTAQPVSGGKS
jgi:hypothetical protein